MVELVYMAIPLSKKCFQDLHVVYFDLLLFIEEAGCWPRTNHGADLTVTPLANTFFCSSPSTSSEKSILSMSTPGSAHKAVC